MTRAERVAAMERVGRAEINTGVNLFCVDERAAYGGGVWHYVPADVVEAELRRLGFGVWRERPPTEEEVAAAARRAVLNAPEEPDA